jgi:Domain of unknown function DUF29
MEVSQRGAHLGCDCLPYFGRGRGKCLRWTARRCAAGQLINDAELDWSNIAEEIEALGRDERSSLRSKITTVIEHLMRLEASPVIGPRRGWRATINRTRRDLPSLLPRSSAKTSPFLHCA